VGKQLRQLEEELGVDLVMRQRSRPVALTPAGERTIVWARRSLQCAANLRATARETRAGDAGGVISVLTTHTLANYLLVPAVTAFSKAYPRVRVNVVQGVHDHVAQLVRDGTVSFGLTRQPRELPPDVLAVPFRTLDLALVTPAGHPLQRVKELTLEKIAAYPLIAQNTARPQGAHVIRRFLEAGVDVNIQVEVLDADVVKTYVAAGLGVGVIPTFTFSARRDHGLRLRNASHLFDSTIAAVLLKRETQLHDYVYAFLELLDPGLERRRIEGLVFGP
jgi:DNA-binding transcriptional LysR family regulator